MIEYKIRGENIDATDAIKNYISKRIDKIEHYFDSKNNPVAHVNIRKYSEKTFKVEVTISLSNITLRAEDTDADFYYAIDLVADKLARQIRKYKTKINRKSREKGYSESDFVSEEIDAFENEEHSIEVIKRKSLALKPMDIDEAILQMEMLNHDFFIFQNVKTNSRDIVYKREDGKYGLIETENIENSK